MSHFLGFGGNCPVELRILGEVVLERYDGGAVEDQSFTGVGVGDVILLAGRDIQSLRENLSVARCLIEQIDKIAVLEDVLYLTGSQQVVG